MPRGVTRPTDVTCKIGWSFLGEIVHARRNRHPGRGHRGHAVVARLRAEIKGVDLTRPLSKEAVRTIQDAWDSTSCWCSRPAGSQDDQLRFRVVFGDIGLRKRAPDKLRSRTEGTLQDANKDSDKVLSSQHQGGWQAIGAFGEGEFWFHIDSGYTPRPYKYTFL